MTVTPPSTAIPGAVPFVLYGERLPGYDAVSYPYPSDIVNRALKWILTGSGYDPGATTFPGLFGPVFNVVAFGAVADGVTDNYTAISNAITAAKAAKGILFFPPAALSYGTSRGWQFGSTDGLTIWAYGATVELLGNAASDAAARLFYFDVPGACTNINIFGITLDGNGTGQTVSEQRSGIFLYRGRNVRLKDVTVTDVMGDCVQIHEDGGGNPCQDIVIESCHFSDSQRHFVSITDGERITIFKCTGDNAQSGGVHIEGEGSTPITRNISVIGCHFTNCGQSFATNQNGAITATGIVDAVRNRDISFIGNTCEDQGIIAFAAEHVEIIGNIVRSATGMGTDGVAIYVTSPYCVIQGNEIIAPTKFGILCSHDTTSVGTYGKSHCTIVGNVIRNIPNNTGIGEGIRLNSGVGCIVKGNVLQNDSATANCFGIRVTSASAPQPGTQNTIEGNKVINFATAFVSSSNCTGNWWVNNEEYTSGTSRYSLVAGDSVVLLPSVSADRGDANVTLVVGADATHQRFETELTGNKTVTLNTALAAKGARFRITRTGLGAFTLDVGGLKTIGSATAAFVDVVYNGSAWVLEAYGAL